MNPVHAVRDRLAGVLPDREPRYDPFADESVPTVGRADVAETTSLEYPLPDSVGDSPVRVLVLYHDHAVECDETLRERAGQTLRIDVPIGRDDPAAFDIRLRCDE